MTRESKRITVFGDVPTGRSSGYAEACLQGNHILPGAVSVLMTTVNVALHLRAGLLLYMMRPGFGVLVIDNN